MTTVLRAALPLAAGSGAGGPVPPAAAGARRAARPLITRVIAVSATLAANEAMAARRRRGQPVLPLGFGEAGLPVHPALRDALIAAAGANGYGPVAGHEALREAAAGYWIRRGLPTSSGQVVAGPGSKPLLFALLLAIGGDVALPRPSWVSYAAQAAMTGTRPHFVPAPAGQGGIPDPDALAATAAATARAGRPIRSVVVTLPDNPTGRLASPATVAALCQVAAAHGLVIICDEIYRDLVHDPTTPFLSPAQAAPERTVITTGLSKNLALGGWRIGVARMPPSPLGRRLRKALLGAGSEIWSAPAAPVQHAAALAFSDTPPITGRITASRALHATVARAAATVCASAGLAVPAPQGGFYVYPGFEPWREHLRRAHQVTTSAALARLLLDRYGAATLPGSAFGEPPAALRLRLATALLYGDTPRQQETALAASDPTALPWIAAALTRLSEILTDLAT
jgi:aspartate aminotransferase